MRGRLDQRFGLAFGFGFALMLGAMTASVSCGDPSPFRCENDLQCASAGEGSQCEVEGYCSVVDPGCNSGRRFVEFAGEGLAEVCLPPDSGSDTDDADTNNADTNNADDSSSTDDDATTEASDDDGTITPTAGSPDDPYGRCEEGCGFPGAVCLESSDENGAFRMCAPPCDVAQTPSSMCPDPFSGPNTVGCLNTGPDGSVACFVNCSEDRDCPNGMICALSTVCSWRSDETDPD